MKTIIDKEKWNRYDLFRHYNERTNPFIIISSKIDITNVYNYAKEHNLSMYSSIGYMITKTANEFDGFKYRVEGNDIVLYDEVISNYTENIDGETIYYFDIPYDEDISKYNENFINTREKVKQQDMLIENKSNEIWLSCAPWFSFITLTTPYDHDNTIPQFIWDKFNKEDGKVTTNLMVMIHHGFMDGFQLGKFYNKLQENINNIKGEE